MKGLGPWRDQTRGSSKAIHESSKNKSSKVEHR